MMKRIYNILLAVLSLAVVACVEDINPDIPSAESGDEVQFGLALGDPETKTVYGNETGNAFPIYWINGDKVQIFSPQCLEGRRSAEYEVSVAKEQQNYADQLTKTGDYGVQWGAAEKAIFYSLYPSGKYTLSNEGTHAQGVTINYSQNIIVNGTTIKSDMEDCLMYAKNDGGETNNFEGVPKGTTVNLAYKPISTVVYVTMEVAENTDAKVDNFTIQSVSLTAPSETYIAGTFSLKIADGSFGEFAANQASNTVLAQITDSSTGGFHTISNKQTLSIPLFLAPVSGLNVNGWKVKVVANNHTYTKTINIDQTLTPGKIHKISLPKFAAEETEWETGNWMENIPRNVYLSEVSIPGSWNTLNSEFQGSDPTISGQYANGVRGFHLDTRWQGGGSAWSPTVSNVLGVANGGNTVEYTNDGRVMTDSDNPSVEDALDEIIENVKTDEYMILICTFAQGSYNHSYTSEGITYDWVGEISRICAQKEAVFDAKQLNQNTLVGDVLGKIIVIINTEGAITSVPSNSKCLFVNIPMKLTSNQFGTSLNDYNIGGINKGTANSTAISDTGIDMYNTQAQVCIAGETYSSTQDRSNVDGRGFAPTFGERKTVANNILSWSKTNYGTESYAHDKWIYLGLGGYYVEYYSGTIFGIGAGWRAANNGHSNVAKDLNTWIDGKVTEMGTIPDGQSVKVPYYPVGIVLMNFVNDYASTVKNILLLNNAYRLQYDPNKPSDYNPNNPNAQTKSAAPSYSSGMNDSNVTAFGWD